MGIKNVPKIPKSSIVLGVIISIFVAVLGYWLPRYALPISWFDGVLLMALILAIVCFCSFVTPAKQVTIVDRYKVLALILVSIMPTIFVRMMWQIHFADVRFTVEHSSQLSTSFVACYWLSVTIGVMVFRSISQVRQQYPWSEAYKAKELHWISNQIARYVTMTVSMSQVLLYGLCLATIWRASLLVCDYYGLGDYTVVSWTYAVLFLTVILAFWHIFPYRKVLVQVRRWGLDYSFVWVMLVLGFTIVLFVPLQINAYIDAHRLLPGIWYKGVSEQLNALIAHMQPLEQRAEFLWLSLWGLFLPWLVSAYLRLTQNMSSLGAMVSILLPGISMTVLLGGMTPLAWPLGVQGYGLAIIVAFSWVVISFLRQYGDHRWFYGWLGPKWGDGEPKRRHGRYFIDRTLRVGLTFLALGWSGLWPWIQVQLSFYAISWQFVLFFGTMLVIFQSIGIRSSNSLIYSDKKTSK